LTVTPPGIEHAAVLGYRSRWRPFARHRGCEAREFTR